MGQQVGLLDEEALWEVINSRNHALDNVIYFGVRSTGIYCKPSCSSRRPSRPQVVFFKSWQQAEEAGFKPCKRCLPRQDIHPNAELVKKICRIIENSQQSPTLNELSEITGVSASHLEKTFKSITGVTPRQYSTMVRLTKFKQQIREGSEIAPALYETGFGSPSRLYETARSQMGMTPGEYRLRGTGLKINFTIVDCYLGRMLIAATEDGICALSLGDYDQVLEDALHQEYPMAEIKRDSEKLYCWVKEVLAHLDGEKTNLYLPIDLQATMFQIRVWNELRKIPYGETRTYAEVANSIGLPKAARAVAQACATNPVSVITPCHRVIRSDGSLAGYRWGIDRKKALLDHERKYSQTPTEKSISD